jgi:hypothetical protein
MQSRQLRDSFQIAGCAPDFVTLSDEELRDGQTNPRTRTSEKNSLHDSKYLFRIQATQYTCCNEVDSYFNYRLDARDPAYFSGIAMPAKEPL